MGYRFSYLAAPHRSITRVRHPAALAMIRGYAGGRRSAASRGVPDDAVRDYLRDQQRLTRLPSRLLEAYGRRSR